MERKFDLYQRAGVREYRAVNPDNDTIRACRFHEVLMFFN
jgi:Uma2 family endonuclease